MQIIETNPNKHTKITTEERSKAADMIKKPRKEGEKMCKGMFEFLDAQGGWFDFSYRIYPGEPIRTVKITHGEIIDIPMTMVKLLNNCYKKVRCFPKDYNADTNAKPGSQKWVTKTSRTRFTPMDAM